VLHVLLPWLGTVKRSQALSALAVIDGQPAQHRGRVEWGSHKTHLHPWPRVRDGARQAVREPISGWRPEPTVTTLSRVCT
jgi:hypothetical protein